MSNPKVFVSHASEDKTRFVTEFATKLRENGVDAWLDKWEMLPGDSLLDKIFEEGLKEASVFIIVISENSIEKPWVHEELNAAAVKRIEKGCTIIPILIDDVEAPEVLKSTLYESIKDLDNYDESFNRISNQIFGTSDKPALGSIPPKYSIPVSPVSDLEKFDYLALKTICEMEIEEQAQPISGEPLIRSIENKGLSLEDINDSLKVLDNRGYIKLSLSTSTLLNVSHLSSEPLGFDTYCENEICNWENVQRSIGIAILNENLKSTKQLVESTNQPAQVVNHILSLFDMNGFIELGPAFFTGTFLSHNIWESTVELKRWILQFDEKE
jgi:hypothetical protein